MVERIKVGLEPEGVALSANGRLVLVSNESGSSVSVIDTNHTKSCKKDGAGGQAAPRHGVRTGWRHWSMSQVKWMHR